MALNETFTQKKQTQHLARSDSLFLAAQLYPEVHEDVGSYGVYKRAEELRDLLSPAKLRALTIRLQRMGCSDKKHFIEMRDKNCDAWELMSFIAATPDHIDEGVPNRDAIYFGFLDRTKKLHQQRQKEKVMRVVGPAVMMAGVMVVGAYLTMEAVGLVSNVTHHADMIGMAADQTMMRWDNVMKPFADHILNAGVDDWIGRIVLVSGLVYMLNPRGSFVDLKSIAMTRETSLLNDAIGPGNKGVSIGLHAAIRAIPEHERILLSHLSPQHLRHFLLGDEKTRKRILTEHPPLLMHELTAILNTPASGLASKVWTCLSEMTSACLPEQWREAMNMQSPLVSAKERLERWRVKSRPEDLPKKQELRSM